MKSRHRHEHAPLLDENFSVNTLHRQHKRFFLQGRMIKANGPVNGAVVVVALKLASIICLTKSGGVHERKKKILRTPFEANLFLVLFDAEKEFVRLCL